MADDPALIRAHLRAIADRIFEKLDTGDLDGAILEISTRKELMKRLEVVTDVTEQDRRVRPTPPPVVEPPVVVEPPEQNWFKRALRILAN